MLMHGEEGFNHYRRLARAFGTPYEYDIFKGEGVPLVPYHPEILPIANAAGTGVMCWDEAKGQLAFNLAHLQPEEFVNDNAQCKCE
jgi:hypothetical protein